LPSRTSFSGRYQQEAITFTKPYLTIVFTPTRTDNPEQGTTIYLQKQQICRRRMEIKGGAEQTVFATVPSDKKNRRAEHS